MTWTPSLRDGREGIETQADELTDRAKDLRQWLNESKIEYLSTTTGADGEYTIPIDTSRLDTASLIAYKTPPGLNADDPRNVTMDNIRIF